MRLSAAVLAAFCILVILWDTFQTIVLSRRVMRRFRLTRAFYQLLWTPWRAVARRLPEGNWTQAGQGNDNSYPDADTDVFLSLDPNGHSDTPSTADTCGDLSATAGPVDWTVDVAVKCNIVNDQLIIPSCRVWEQNANHKVSCQTLQQAGTGSKCDCTPLVVTTQLNPCVTADCDDDDVCTNDSCQVVTNPDGTKSARCVHTPGNAGTVCREKMGVCDVEDTCDGINPGCTDQKQPSTTICRASTGECDVAESCTGTSGACPADGFQPKTTACTGTSNGGACDGTDSCDGAGHCEDGFQPMTTICRPAVGQCDVAESCTGSGSECPPDVGGVCEEGKIAPTATTCQDFTGGTAGDLTQILYGVKNQKINNVSPGVLFYYSSVTAPASSFTIQVVQTNNMANFPFFGIQKDQVRLYNADCSNSSLGTFTTNGGVITITVTGATPGAVFVVGVKYNPGTVVGTNVGLSPPTVHYDFSTDVNGVPVAADPDGGSVRSGGTRKAARNSGARRTAPSWFVFRAGNSRWEALRPKASLPSIRGTSSASAASSWIRPR